MVPEPTEEEEYEHTLPLEYETRVYANRNGMIAILQVDPMGGDDQCVVISTARVDALIALLRAVKDEILTEQADEAESRTNPPPSNG